MIPLDGSYYTETMITLRIVLLQLVRQILRGVIDILPK